MLKLKCNFNSEAREWRHDSDKTQTNKLEWWMILKISLKAKAGVHKALAKQKLRLHSPASSSDASMGQRSRAGAKHVRLHTGNELEARRTMRERKRRGVSPSLCPLRALVHQKKRDVWERGSYIPCISLRKRFCWPSLAGKSVICILFLDFVRFAITDYYRAFLTSASNYYWYLLYFLVSTRAVIGQFSGPYSPVRPAKL